MSASWSCSVATSSGDWIGVMKGTSGATALWYKDYSAGVKSDTVITSDNTDYYAWKVPSGTGVVYTFFFVHNSVLVARSSSMVSY